MDRASAIPIPRVSSSGRHSIEPPGRDEPKRFRNDRRACSRLALALSRRKQIAETSQLSRLAVPDNNIPTCTKDSR